MRLLIYNCREARHYGGALPCCILPIMDWGRVALLRTAVLSLAGFGALCVGAFLFSIIVGWLAVGVSLLIIEALTNPSLTMSRRA